MWSVATPIIVGGKHVGNLFSGQFFFTDEQPNGEFFRAQAKRYGFSEQKYMAALENAPRFSREFLHSAMEFYIRLAKNIAQASWNNICLGRAVAQAKMREEEMRRLNRMFKARSRSDQVLVRATDERQLLDEICKVIVEDCGYPLVWVGFAEHDKNKTVRPVACAGRGIADVKVLHISWADTERGQSPSGLAIRTGKPNICRNVHTDEMRPWREVATHSGYTSIFSLPLMADDKAFGALAVCSDQPNAFPEDELSLLSGIADDLAYGIGALRMRSARNQAEEKFLQAQKMEAVGLLAGGVAHDFNNILGSIVGYNALLLEGLKGNKLRAHSLEIKRSSEMAATLTKQLLGVSGNRGGQSRVLNANKVITSIAKMMRGLVGEKIRLDLKLHRSVWPIKMDSGQLEQVVMNLAVNARDAMPEGGGITLTTKNVLLKSERDGQADPALAPGRYVVLEVRDNGIGMEADLQSRIFEPFFTTKSSGRGTGLGLPTVKSIVESYGGRITVERALGWGSIFRVYLPSVEGEGKGRACEGKVSGGRVKKSPRGHETILVVEDNASLLILIKMALQGAGYSLFFARNAEEAVAQCGEIQRGIDLLLTDVVLPGMNGPELAKRLKKIQPEMRTVFMSGYPGDALDPLAGFGGCVLLEKPFTPQKMLGTLRKVLDIDQDDLV
jgi:signal transduction histidine kinase